MSPDGTPFDIAGELELKAERVVTLGEEMSDLLDREVDILLERNPKTYGVFVAQKQKLLMDYQGAVKSLLSKREDFNSLTPARRAQLKATGSRLDAKARQSSEKLSLTAAATHKVLQVIIDTVRREAQVQHGTSNYHPSQFSNYRDDRAPTSIPVFVAEKA